MFAEVEFLGTKFIQQRLERHDFSLINYRYVILNQKVNKLSYYFINCHKNVTRIIQILAYNLYHAQLLIFPDYSDLFQFYVLISK